MKTYYCNCEKYCQGDRKEVSKTTFFKHKKYRDLFTPQFQDYLNRHPVITSDPGPSRRLTEGVEVVVDRDGRRVQYHISLAFSSSLITIC
jgi:hypothetical protein